jgi:predicted NACHT family NTPase
MISLDSMIAESIRELGWRRRTYAMACQEGRMNRRLADSRIDLMEAIAERLMKDRDAESTEGKHNADDQDCCTRAKADRGG